MARCCHGNRDQPRCSLRLKHTVAHCALASSSTAPPALGQHALLPCPALSLAAQHHHQPWASVLPCPVLPCPWLPSTTTSLRAGCSFQTRLMPLAHLLDPPNFFKKNLPRKPNPNPLLKLKLLSHASETTSRNWVWAVCFEPLPPGKCLLQHLVRVVSPHGACVYGGGSGGDSPDNNYWNVSTIEGKAFPMFSILYYYM